MCSISVVYVFLLYYPAEREGFEPPDPRRSTVFKTAAFDRSAISPGAKLRTISEIKKPINPAFLLAQTSYR